MEVETPGGTMRMSFAGEFLEVVEPELLVYTEAMTEPAGNPVAASGGPEAEPTATEVRVQLTDRGGRTELTLTHLGVPADSPGAAGWEMALDKLAAHATSMDGP